MSCFIGLVGLLILAGLLYAIYRLGDKLKVSHDRISRLEESLAELRGVLGHRIQNLESRLGLKWEATESPEEATEAPVPAAATPPAPAAGVGPVEGPPDTAPMAPEPVPPETPPAPLSPPAEAEAPAEEPPGVGLVSPPVEPPPPAGPPRPRFDWEQWIGVRGAAVLGGVVLALAGVLFLRYAIEQGWFPPGVRVALAVLTGIGSIVGAESLRKRGYEAPANSLAGAGVVLLYAAGWAAAVLYQLIPIGLGFGFMVLTTVVCGLLSWRHHSLVIATLGLVGGFATPLLLATWRDRPVGLFGYVLLLNAGLLVLARRRGWPALGLLSLIGTLLYQFLWIFFQMKSAQAALGLAIVGLFGLLFALSGGIRPRVEEAGKLWGMTRAAGVLFPFAFALYFAARADLGRHLYPLAALILFLSVASEWLGRVHGWRRMGVGAAAAGVAVVWVWCLRTAFDEAFAWELAAISVALALVFHVFLEVDHRRGAAAGEPHLAPPVAAIGLFTGLVFVHWRAEAPTLWPWLVGWLALATLLVRQSRLTGGVFQPIVAAFGLGLGFLVFFFGHAGTSGFVSPVLYFGLALAVAVAFQILALRRYTARRAAEAAAAVLPFTILIGLAAGVGHSLLTPGLFLVTTSLLALLAALSATRYPSGKAYFVAMVTLAAVHWLWTVAQGSLDEEPQVAVLALVLQGLAAVVFTFWPFLAGKTFGSDAWSLYAAALAGPAWFLSLEELFESRFGDAVIAIVPLALGLMAIAAALWSRRRWAPGQEERRRSLVWFFAVALGFVSVAIPLQLEKEWITLGWALEGVAVLALWKRLDHAGLKYFGLALLAATTVRLIANPALLGYYPRSEWPVFNWLMYTYLVPAAALLGSGSILARLELERRRPWERSRYPAERPLAAISCGLAAIAVVFMWINLTIFDAFSSGPVLTVSFERLPARDLTLSLAWAIYALLLVAVGMARKSVGLRGIGLGFLTLTILKVFLYDLGELKDLYRVASLMGLAVSLFLVSLAYYRFVLRKESEAESEDE